MSKPGAFLIVFTTADGEEREERWSSVEAFRRWALTEGLRVTWRAFQEDLDGDWTLMDEGAV